ncbi:LppU/SCO3897 family protein [Actinomadura chokoriensis]|uniref:Septum formation-related domain-containing protein n=1 Tax=Actinomadura chokoriensis TaxID=454156 RepID=A0ABV4QYR1_9ACTN
MQGQGRAPDGPDQQGAPAPPPAPPPAKKPSPLVWVVVGLAVVFFVGATGFMLIKGGGGLDGPVKAGQCVDTGFGTDGGSRVPASIRVSCDDSSAKAKVLKITDEREASGFTITSRSEPDCPSGTDGVANVRGKKTDEKYYEACVRNLKSPHPGDPGAGGAFLSVGDCVSSGSIGFGKEQACSKPNWYGKIIARVDTEKSCPAQTLEVMKLRSFSGKVARPVLCLGPGGGVLAAGDCIEDPSFNVGDLDKADCGSSQAIAKVVGRAETPQKCPAGATNYMTSEGAYLPVLCLKKLRPTLNEKLRSLPG